MSKRDELAKAIFIADNSRLHDAEQEWERLSGHPALEYTYPIADYLIAKGWTTRRAVVEGLVEKLTNTEPGPNWLGYKAWACDWLRAELEGDGS